MDLAFFREAEEETLPLTAQRSVPETPVRYKLDNSSSALRVIPQRISLSAVGATESSVEATRSKHSRIVKVAEDTVLTPSEVANHALQAFVNCVIDLARSNNSGRLREFTMHPGTAARWIPRNEVSGSSLLVSSYADARSRDRSIWRQL
eukprot:scaffold3864_cov248-Pinguiococcus_pyrenoidosus.AAC.4